MATFTLSGADTCVYNSHTHKYFLIKYSGKFLYLCRVDSADPDWLFLLESVFPWRVLCRSTFFFMHWADNKIVSGEICSMLF